MDAHVTGSRAELPVRELSQNHEWTGSLWATSPSPWRQQGGGGGQRRHRHSTTNQQNQTGHTQLLASVSTSLLVSVSRQASSSAALDTDGAVSTLALAPVSTTCA